MKRLALELSLMRRAIRVGLNWWREQRRFKGLAQ
jgi:hypothetical protein